MTLEEFRAASADHLAALSERADLYIGIRHDRLLSVLSDGRFKTQFETGHSGGAMAPDRRRATENALWGIPDSAPPSERPIYGYTAEDPFEHRQTWGYSDNEGIAVRLKPGVKQRSTLTVGDSLDLTDSGRIHAVAPAPYDRPDLAATQRTIDPLGMDAHGMYGMNGRDFQPYSEVQVFGGVAVDDIAEVVFSRQVIPRKSAMQDRAKAALRAAGIPYRMVG